MSGCDYLPSMERMGLKTAIKNFAKYKNFDGMIRFLRSHKTFKERIPKNYFEAVRKVHDLFLYQTVYCPYTLKCRPLNDIPEGKEIDQAFLGPLIEPEYLQKYVKGHLNKYTMEDREIYDPDIKMIQSDMKGNSITMQTFYYLKEKYDFSNKDKQEDDSDEENNENNGQKGKL